MFACSACMERSLQELVGRSVLSTQSARTSVTTATRHPVARNYASMSNGWNTKPPNLNKVLRAQQKRMVPNASARMMESGGVPIRVKDYKLEKTMGRVLEKHPAYANDPLKLAEFTRKALRGDDIETSFAVVRAASKSLSCTVSWNHIIDWQMTKGKMNAAFKTFNEMKKRGQNPDAHTYTIIIRGCTEHKDLSQALGKVIAIYQSMLAEKSAVKPNAIHVNAVLKMCARAHDLDAMFGIVSQMPSKGIGAPDNRTYTTILNGLRMCSLGDLRSPLSPMQKRQNIEKAILNARHLWHDIINKWRQGDIWIDEELVCSMGRLLLIGGERDWDDILSLIAQTMNIPRQIAGMNVLDRKIVESSIDGTNQEALVLPDANTSTDTETQESDIEDLNVVSNLDIFQAITPPKSQSRLSAFAKPGRNTLSLILSTVLKLGMKAPAEKYWDIMVNKIGVVPDTDNYHIMLRILRVNRSSSETIRLLQAMRKTDMSISTFRIAMASCDRDKNNPHSFSNAGKIIDIMTEAYDTPDIPVLISYIDIACANSSRELSQLARGKQILRALERLNPSFVNIKALLNHGDSAFLNLTSTERIELQNQALLLIRRMISAYDLLMDKALVPRDAYSTLTAERSKLSAFVTRYNISKGEREPSSEELTLARHLEEWLATRHLTKQRVLARTSKRRWTRFVERIEAMYEKSQQDEAKRLSSNNGELPNPIIEAEQVAEEGQKAAQSITENLRSLNLRA
ncbi:hypothetical protein BJ875DRAFT_448381 [Amylocarpus encephaloides]|uniref:Pentacotripeptide-repeat region of PRORP domain-containing protein n=1 Tax=Amylocarpus encephaloides TaxID=45428 RepID=A0A9P8CAB5_9HELO|nr:hypothetical protein BJ875DRAFT_448381 [Amylocarpus encephaloides]